MQNRALGRGHLERHIELTREGKEKKVTLNISNTALLLPCYTAAAAADGRADVWHDRASDELLEMLCRPAVVVAAVVVVKADSADNRAAADKQKLVNG